MLEERVRRLEAVFRGIAATRMADVPICHPRLAVRAIGFQRSTEEPDLAWGVLLTPWCMNLLRLPLQRDDAAALPQRHGALRRHGGRDFEFLGAFEPELGAYESCSLFSPMFDFADQAAAEAVAGEVLALLRAPLGAPLPPVPAATAGPSRRGLLFGRSAAEHRP